ncbi:MAG: aldehyde ferredoxin oxidoreductase, partial [Betaproteobacteria bacterium]|nr:aldehyde ferredoxin oxidoreductase [Betaproteobacteria bacterium]
GCKGAFGDVGYMMAALEDMRKGNERGRLLAQGTARVGAHYKFARVPVIKRQGISAYDPRVIEVTGISMMTTAQGADHTAGHAPTYDCNGKSTKELTEVSFDTQVLVAAVDSLGLCIFGRSVTNVSHDLIVSALNDAHGTSFETSFIKKLGRDVLRMEWEFNRQAGFTEADDALPEFFNEPVAPTGKSARHSVAEINQHLRGLIG